MQHAPSFLVALVGTVLVSAAACGGSSNPGFDEGDDDDGGSSGESPLPVGDGGGLGNVDSGGGGFTGDPKTCAQAEQAASYVGCDYWPTVTFNSVFTQFDFAVVVSNVGDGTANVTVTGPNGVNENAAVEPHSLATIKLPWVARLKGTEAVSDPIGGGVGAIPNTASVFEAGGAYHLVSDIPVVVYQFSPLEYTKDDDVLSVTNDASLLLPSTAMTGNYRLMGLNGLDNIGTFVTITGTQDDTQVDVELNDSVRLLGGDSIPSGSGTVTLTLNAGDVAQLLTDGGTEMDLSGSLVKASKPVQVLTGTQLALVPADKGTGDHLEETVFPAETLGSHYLVQRPAGPKGDAVGQRVRLYGNVDGTQLTYTPSKPSGCPDSLDASQVLDCGEISNDDFEVKGDHEFGIGMFQQGCTVVDPGQGMQAQGDPSESFAVAVEQYRDSYVVLAPIDYLQNWVALTAPSGAQITLDGNDVSDQLEPLDGTNYVQARIELSNDGDGSHTLKGSMPFGVQTFGYGAATSYQYPGGLNLGKIAPAPVH